MTLGFAATTWLNGEPLIMVASDTRITAGNTVATDMGVKTYELGGRCAMVAAGAALPPMMAAELTRSVVENHNRRTPEKRANLPVGREDGKALLLRAVDVATKEGRPRFSAAVATLLYIAKHEGAFQSVGGGIAVGTCEGSREHFSWPIVEIDGKRYMH